MLRSRFRRNPVFFTTTEPASIFNDPLGGKITKNTFYVPRVTHTAQEELFSSIRAQGDDAGNDSGKVWNRGGYR